MNFEPGQLIVKFKDDYRANITYDSKGVGTTKLDLNAILGIKAELKTSKVMFFEESVKLSVARKEAQDIRLKMSSANGATTNNGFKEPEITTLKNIFKLEFENKDENVFGLIEKIKSNPNVEYVEPNYVYSINDYEIASETTYDDPLYEPNNELGLATPDDPLYSTQSNIVSTNIDDVWTDYNTGDGTQIIAIIDTGVDYTHPDLEANIWINTAEQNGVEGFDDDGNGYIDDIRGWDFINNDNAPLDDNMHGTHVAGIAGAVGNNGLGISGAAWNVKLMPIKVFQSSGRGNSADIAKAVEYATSNGATIQNMSFGSYAESSTLKAALDLAYASSLLVAAAGNDDICIGPAPFCAPFFPAAYTYVLGVEDNAKYSNYDQDGPIYSKYTNLWNYELKAPGSILKGLTRTGINSTVPNGGYRLLIGTSMATPLVAGAMALYHKEKPSDSKELIFGNLINTSGSTYVDFKAAIEITPTPLLKFISAENKDDINSQNGNGFWEPGETIEIFPLIKNYWGPTTDVRVGIEFAEFEDTSKATIVESEIAIGSISAYANLKHVTKSLKIKIADNVANNVDIKFKVSVWSGPDKEYLSSNEYIVNVKNSILLYGVYDEDMTLKADKEYLVTNNLIFMSDAVLTIEPGTTLTFSDQMALKMQENSQLIAIGKKDSLITFTGETAKWAGLLFPSQTRSEISFSIIEYISLDGGGGGDMFSHDSDNVEIEDVIFRNNYSYTFDQNYPNSASSGTKQPGAGFTRLNLDGNYFYHGVFDFSNASSWFPEKFDDLNITNTKTKGYHNRRGILQFSISAEETPDMRINVLNSWTPESSNNAYEISSYGNKIITHVEPYIGTTDTDKINELILDAFNLSTTSSLIDRSYISTVPYEGAHGIVWKILVNGKDAQDEYDQMDAIGVGNHEFKVYFNRQMDTLVKPNCWLWS
jgi:subtilisin family serine protease